MFIENVWAKDILKQVDELEELKNLAYSGFDFLYRSKKGTLYAIKFEKQKIKYAEARSYYFDWITNDMKKISIKDTIDRYSFLLNDC